METQNQNNNSNQNPDLNQKDDGIGALIASIIIILIIIVGAFYFYTTVKVNVVSETPADESEVVVPNDKEDENTEGTEVNQKAVDLRSQGTSTDIAELEAELEAEGFDDLDTELEAIEAEF